jgi:two-component system response regulator NreC
MKQVRILIAGDSKFFRPRTLSLVKKHHSWKIEGEAATESELFSEAEAQKPDVIVLDIDTPALGGIEGAMKIRRMHPNTKIIIVSVCEEEEVIRKALNAGVHGYLLRRAFSRRIISAVHAICSGHLFLCDRVVEIVMRGYLNGTARRFDMPPPRYELTVRELEIVRLLALGHGNNQIAGVLGIRVRTVETHRAHIMRKLNLHSLVALIHYAISKQIINIQLIPSVQGASNKQSA